MLDLGLKGLFARPRPALYPHLEPETSFALPSGHGLVAPGFFPALALLLRRALSGRWRYAGSSGLLLALAGMARGGAGPKPFDHVFLFVLENRSYVRVIDNPDLPRVNALAKAYALEDAWGLKPLADPASATPMNVLVH